MTLADFLLARIADAEMIAGEFVPEEIEYPSIELQRYIFGGKRWVVLYQPTVVLAECAAKRAIIAELKPGRHEDLGIAAATSRYLLSLLAVPYSDHPDYDESWRP